MTITHGSYTPTDVLSIERRGTQIYYLKNGAVFYISDVPDSGNPLMGDVSIFSSEGKIKDLVLVDLENELQEVDYTYNIRGWLKGINAIEQTSDLFSFMINYNDIADPTKKLFNGNISSTQWKTKGQDNFLKSYVYDYDALNRITKAVDNKGYYTLDLVDYDLNGNITALKRTGHINAGATSFGNMTATTKASTNIQLDSIHEAIEDIRQGKVIIVVDDENRENEGDFLAAAEKVTPEMINFMATHGSFTTTNGSC